MKEDLLNFRSLLVILLVFLPLVVVMLFLTKTVSPMWKELVFAIIVVNTIANIYFHKILKKFLNTNSIE